MIRRTVSCLFLAALLFALGCLGSKATLPDMAKVAGTVLLDGNPVADATVTFHSTSAGRQSSGTTDANGHYTLMLSPDIAGAPLGENKVYITTAKPGDDSIPGSEKPKTLPAIYNSKTTLTATVTEGSNTFDFDLKSK